MKRRGNVQKSIPTGQRAILPIAANWPLPVPPEKTPRTGVFPKGEPLIYV
jgi:hypothetical protein